MDNSKVRRTFHPPDAPSHDRGYQAPGRLSDPGTQLYLDPRLNAKLMQTLVNYGLDRTRAPPSLARLTPGATPEELSHSMAEIEAGFEQLYEFLPNELMGDALELEVVRELETIPGPNHAPLDLHIFRPALQGGPLPGIAYFHGGAMTVLRTMNRVHARWCTSLAAQGMVVVAVDFRNAWTEAGFNPFPAGLQDCCTAVQWVHAHRDRFNIRNLVVHGEDGGGNLALAVALKAVQEGWSSLISGVYACSPCISGAYSWSEASKIRELPSLVECHGYFVNVDMQAYMARVYTPNADDARNPLAWPYHATRYDMAGLPPHVIVVDELDPFRDEGVMYFRKLSTAGVSCVGHINLGQTHVASILFRQTDPDAHQAAVLSVAAFAKHS